MPKSAEAQMEKCRITTQSKTNSHQNKKQVGSGERHLDSAVATRDKTTKENSTFEAEMWLVQSGHFENLTSCSAEWETSGMRRVKVMPVASANSSNVPPAWLSSLNLSTGTFFFLHISCIPRGSWQPWQVKWLWCNEFRTKSSPECDPDDCGHCTATPEANPERIETDWLLRCLKMSILPMMKRYSREWTSRKMR